MNTVCVELHHFSICVQSQFDASTVVVLAELQNHAVQQSNFSPCILLMCICDVDFELGDTVCH